MIYNVFGGIYPTHDPLNPHDPRHPWPTNPLLPLTHDTRDPMTHDQLEPCPMMHLTMTHLTRDQQSTVTPDPYDTRDPLPT